MRTRPTITPMTDEPQGGDQPVDARAGAPQLGDVDLERRVGLGQGTQITTSTMATPTRTASEARRRLCRPLRSEQQGADPRAPGRLGDVAGGGIIRCRGPGGAHDLHAGPPLCRPSASGALGLHRCNIVGSSPPPGTERLTPKYH